jgi:hypothetical protein
MPDSKRNSRNKEIRGNVIVSVRVRPDVAGQDTSRAEGEWMVDGRRSLVAYRGREGGDYHYGELKREHAWKVVTDTEQITCLPRMMTMPKSTILPLSVW